MNRIDAILASISQWLNKFGAYVVLPVMATMMTADVVLRYAFNSPLSWGLEASEYLLLLLFLLGMPEAFRSGAHIRMDLFYRTHALAVRRLVNLIYSALVVFVFVLLIRHGWDEAVFLAEIDQVTQYIHMPVSAFIGAIVLMAALIVALFVVRACAILRGRREEIEDGSDVQSLYEEPR